MSKTSSVISAGAFSALVLVGALFGIAGITKVNPGTASMMDLNGILSGAFKGVK